MKMYLTLNDRQILTNKKRPPFGERSLLSQVKD